MQSENLPPVLAGIFAAAPTAGGEGVGAPCRLTGVIAAARPDATHPTLTVKDAQGALWTVTLCDAECSRTGLAQQLRTPGDQVTVLGHRDPRRKRIEAARVSVRGRDYDLRPERLG